MNTTIWHRDGTFQYVQVFSSTVSIQYCNTRICNYTVSQNQKKNCANLSSAPCLSNMDRFQ